MSNDIEKVASELVSLNKNIALVYAFNATGKTRLSVSYKDETKKLNADRHSGVYYNAFSEDLFIWNNDEENDGESIKLTVLKSSLSKFHNLFNEEQIREKLKPYNPKYDFRFEINEAERGIESITFFMPEDEDSNIKISRGEERIFVWCFFLALFEVDGWADEQDSHFFIDDPVSSLDDHNIYITAITIFDLIEKHFEKRKIIVTTHHLGLFSILADWFEKGSNKDKFYKGKEALFKIFFLNKKEDGLFLEKPQSGVYLYHLFILRELKKAKDEEKLLTYHFVLLRQVLENISSFLGYGNFGGVLSKIGIDDVSKVSDLINAESHKKIYYNQTVPMVPDNVKTFNEVLEKLLNKYEFKL